MRWEIGILFYRYWYPKKYRYLPIPILCFLVQPIPIPQKVPIFTDTDPPSLANWHPSAGHYTNAVAVFRDFFVSCVARLVTALYAVWWTKCTVPLWYYYHKWHRFILPFSHPRHKLKSWDLIWILHLCCEIYLFSS